MNQKLFIFLSVTVFFTASLLLYLTNWWISEIVLNTGMSIMIATIAASIVVWLERGQTLLKKRNHPVVAYDAEDLKDRINEQLKGISQKEDVLTVIANEISKTLKLVSWEMVLAIHQNSGISYKMKKMEGKLSDCNLSLDLSQLQSQPEFLTSAPEAIQKIVTNSGREQVFMPMVSESRFEGAIILGSKPPGELFTDRDFKILRSIIGQSVLCCSVPLHLTISSKISQNPWLQPSKPPITKPILKCVVDSITSS